jgi:3-dehydroquinate synthase
VVGQTDASIGGKTAVDLVEGKNLVGAFYQPRMVSSDVNFLKTLNIRQVQSGLAEVIKYGLIKDGLLFAYLEKRYKDILAQNTACLEYIVRRCSKIKAGIVAKDEKEESGLRTILNFGHTIGHAIEAAGGFKAYNHGEAIALGMLVAAGRSRGVGRIDDSESARIEKLIQKVGLPSKIQGLSQEAVINAHYRDKKFIGPKNRFVLIRGIGKTQIQENIPLGVIKEALRLRF